MARPALPQGLQSGPGEARQAGWGAGTSPPRGGGVPPGPYPRTLARRGLPSTSRDHKRGLHRPRLPPPAHAPPPPDPRAPDCTWARPAPGAPPAVNAAPAPQIPPAGLAGGAGSENKGAAPASFPAAASLAVPTALAGPAARTHRRIVRAALALPPAQNDERRCPARARPAGHFRGHATSARAGRAADSACARSCGQRAAAILRAGLVGASVWAARQRGLTGWGSCALCHRLLLVPGIPRKSAGKLKGRGSETVCEVLGRACVTGASPSAGISPSEGTLPSRRGDEPAQPVPSRSRGQRVAAVRP